MATKFYVWATLLTDAYVDGFIARLARRRYHVGPLSNDGSGMIQASAGSTLLSLEVSKFLTSDDFEELAKLLAANPSDEDEHHEDEEDVDGAEVNSVGVEEYVMAEIKAILSEMGAKWHSLIVHDVDGGFSWEGSNIGELPKPTVPAAISSLLSDKDEFS